MRAPLPLTLCVLLVCVLGQENPARADINIGVESGWRTWQVEAVDDAPEMCCFRWRNGESTRQSCHLDRQSGGFTNSRESASVQSHVQIFALIDEGSIKEVRALSSSCPITANSPISDLGPVSANDSLAQLRPLLEVDDEIAEGALAAIAVHRGSDATNILLDTAENHQSSDVREESIFWMAQVRINETALTLKKYVLQSHDPDIREHAAFAYSQSTASDVSDVLIEQGRTDRNADVRSQAWFWLAETGAAESEQEISRAVRDDPDPDVREEAVFALSQLPEGRAVPALAAVLEDRKLSLDVREQALFWLAQTESEAAFEYIDRLLSNN